MDNVRSPRKPGNLGCKLWNKNLRLGLGFDPGSGAYVRSHLVTNEGFPATSKVMQWSDDCKQAHHGRCITTTQQPTNQSITPNNQPTTNQQQWWLSIPWPVPRGASLGSSCRWSATCSRLSMGLTWGPEQRWRPAPVTWCSHKVSACLPEMVGY